MAKKYSSLAANAPAANLIAELRQPLAASANYVAAARLCLQASKSPGSGEAVKYLEKADEQILRAGEVVGRLRSAIVGYQSADTLPL